MKHLTLPYGLLLLAACGQDIGITKDAICDGRVQPAEDTVDQPFDVDGDGFFDGGNPDCQDAYAPEQLDCDDGNPDVHPGAAEVPCDGVDDDCDASTLDGPDADGDGISACTDCDDADPLVNPGTPELDCNGLDDDCNEATPDGEDVDVDGFSACTDCDDVNPYVNPGHAEVACNLVDDDCSPGTPDSSDLDFDGELSCTDCDDADDTRSHDFEEVCANAIDDDCDSEVDEGCVIDRTGTWDLDQTLVYSCAFSLVSINFDSVFIEDSYPTLAVTSTGTGAQPGTMTGAYASADDFEVNRTVSGTCDEVYTLVGTFTSATTFTGTFTAEFVGGRACYDCTDQSWTINGTF